MNVQVSKTMTNAINEYFKQNGKQTAHLLKLRYDEKRGEPFFKVCNRKIYLSACIVDKPAFLAALKA